MKNRIELTIEHKDHYTVELTNEKGDTFTYNPLKHEGLEDFLSGAKILLIADVSVPVAEVRQAFGDYVSTEGCSCCQDVEGHEKASNRLGELLNADQYDDESGYDWYKYATER